MDEGTDEQRDQSDFIGCCPTNKKLDGKEPKPKPKNAEAISLKFTESTTPNITEKYIITFFYSK